MNLLYILSVHAVSKHRILGVDGGATKTSWMLCEEEGGAVRVLREGRLGPGNMKLLSPEALRALLSELPRDVTHAGIYLAGCATEKDRAGLVALAKSIWTDTVVAAGSDRESAFAAAFGSGDGIAVIAGTGSAVTGRKNGVEDRAGGWGHLLGDSGGGYDLAIHALRDVLFAFDTARRVTPFAQDVLRTLGLDSLRELTLWAQAAQKNDLARLTPLVFEHAEETAPILQAGAEALARLTAAVAQRLEMDAPTVRLMGGLFARQSCYSELFGKALTAKIPGAHTEVCTPPATLGAVRLALQAPETVLAPAPSFSEPELHDAPTEQTNPRSIHLDTLGTRELVELFVREERCVEEALAAVADSLTRGVDLIASALAAGGRLFYAGAGTSGRLGVLDASEMPPTFGVSPSLVQAIIAGGAAAIQQSIEGAEDDVAAGARAVRERGVTAHDVVCGITASGRTPFVRGALEAAAALGAGTVLITCNPHRKKDALLADVGIDLPTGPELVTGSTRLKAGTATKVALNILSTGTMIRLGRVDGNFMSCLQPTNDKLRDRAARFVAGQLAISEQEARERLECANWNIRAAIHASNGVPSPSETINRS
jgi:N-acetylmuramic acid 6-phosphate etherase